MRQRLEGCGEKRTLVHRWLRCELVQPLWKTVCRFRKKLEIELEYDPVFILLGCIPPQNENRILKRYMHSDVYCSIIHSSQGMETILVPINRWMDKKDVMCTICIHSGILSSHEKGRSSCHLQYGWGLNTLC